MSPAEPLSALFRSCREISTNSGHRARTLSRLRSGCAAKAQPKYVPNTGAGSKQKTSLFQPLAKKASAAQQAVLKTPSQRCRGRGRQALSQGATNASGNDEAGHELEQLSVAAVRRSRFSERLQDAQRIEDLFELVRDAERLTASEVAQLPLALARLYQQRTEREQQAMVAEPFFEALVKPWALEPSKLTAQEQLATLYALITIDEWKTTAGPALTKAIFMMAHAVRSSLASVPKQFTAAELLQLLTSCNKKATLRNACPSLPLACLTACTAQLEVFSPDQTAQAAFLAAQTPLQLNASSPSKMQSLVKAGIEQAADVSSLSITQLMFAAVATGGFEPAKLRSLAAAALKVAPKRDSTALKNLVSVLGTAELDDQQLLAALEETLQSQSFKSAGLKSQKLEKASSESQSSELRGQSRQATPTDASNASAQNEKQASSASVTDEVGQELEQLSVAAVRRSRFSERLQDAQRVEDLFELVRDAERLTASEVAQLPLALARLYQQRSEREQQTMAAQPFFEALAKPWALEPAKLTVQEQLATLDALIEIDEWKTTAGPALPKAIFLTAHAVKNSLASVPKQYTIAELLQLLTSCNKKATLRNACPSLPLACLTACTAHLEFLTPDQTAQAAFLGVQTRLRLNVSGPSEMRTLVKTGIGRAAEMTPLCLTQLMFAAVALGGAKAAKMQVLTAAALKMVSEFDAAALKNLMWALGTAEFHDQQLLVAVEAQLKSQSAELGAPHLSTAVWAFGRLNHSPALDLMHELANQAMLKSSSFTVPHARRLLWGFYTLRFYPPEALIEAIAKHVEPAVKSLDPYDLSNFIWAFGGLGYQPSNMQLFLQAAQDCSYRMNSTDISQSLRGLANLRLASGALGQDLLQRASAILDTFNTQALANLSWSMAHLGFKHVNLLDKIISQLAWNVDEVNPRDLAEVLSALALLNHDPEPEAMDEMLYQLTKLLRDSDVKWQQQDLSTVLWSLAKLNAGTRKLIDLMFNHTVVDIPSLSAKDISYQLWSFVVLGFPLQYQVVKAYEDRLLLVLDEIDPVDLSHVMWAVARLDKYPSPALLDSLLATLPPQIDEAEPTAVATTVHACGHLRHHPEEAFLEAVEGHAQSFSRYYSCANWSALLQTFTRFQAPAKQLYSALLQQVQAGDLQVDSRLLGDVLMSVAVSKAWQEPIYTHMLAQARSLAQTSFGPRALHQLYQVNLLAQATGVADALDLSESFKSQEQQRWLQSQLPFNTTQLVGDLCATLDVLRIPYRRGPPAGHALMTIDIALVDKKVAIETLGPLKVLKNRSSITGQAAHRQNLLSALGWTVVPVKETDWLNLKTPADKEWRLWQLLP